MELSIRWNGEARKQNKTCLLYFIDWNIKHWILDGVYDMSPCASADASTHEEHQNKVHPSLWQQSSRSSPVVWGAESSLKKIRTAENEVGPPSRNMFTHRFGANLSVQTNQELLEDPQRFSYFQTICKLGQNRSGYDHLSVVPQGLLWGGTWLVVHVGSEVEIES